LLLLLGIALTLTTARLITACLGVVGRAAVFTGVWIASLVVVVMVCEVASLFHRLTPGFLLLLHALLLGGMIAWWRRGGSPALLPAGLRWAPAGRFGSPRRHPALWLLAVVVLFVMLFNALLVFLVPPNNWDSMTYHLARVGYWLQHQSFYPWNTHNLRQTIFPPNVEILQMWCILLAGSDRVAGLVQWTAGLVSMTGVAALAGCMGATRPQCLFAGLLWATFPQVLLQSTTTQNDLTVAAATVCTLHLLLLGLQRSHHGMLWLSGLGVGLIIGMKLTWAFLAPGVVLGVLILWGKHRGRMLRPLQTWVAACIVGILLLGSFAYVQNAIVYGHPLAPRSFAERSCLAEGVTVPERGLHNMIRHTYQAADLTGIPYTWAAPLQNAKRRVLRATAGSILPELAEDYRSPFKGVYHPIPPFPHEDLAWFGPIFFVLIVPMIFFHFWPAVRDRDPTRMPVILVGLGMLLTGSALLGWEPYNGRMFVPAAAVLTSLCAWAYRPGWSPWSLGVVGCASFVAVWVTIENPQKPLAGSKVIWSRDAIGRRAAAHQKREVRLALIAECLPADATVGLLFGNDEWDFPIFGPSFGRRLVPICPDSPLGQELNSPPWQTVLHADDYPARRVPFHAECDAIDRAWLRAQGVTHLALSIGRGEEHEGTPTGFETLARTRSLRLMRALDANSPPFAPTTFAPSTSRAHWVPQSGPIIEIAPSLDGLVGIWGFAGPSWNLQKSGPDTTVWVGHGSGNSLTCTFWSDAARDAALIVEVACARALPSGVPDLECYFETTGVSTNRILSSRFPSNEKNGLANPVAVHFPLSLAPGYNYFELRPAARAPDAEPLWSGDQGPAVLIRRVRIAPRAAFGRDE